jgi:hypothetical protein
LLLSKMRLLGLDVVVVDGLLGKRRQVAHAAVGQHVEGLRATGR